MGEVSKGGVVNELTGYQELAIAQISRPGFEVQEVVDGDRKHRVVKLSGDCFKLFEPFPVGSGRQADVISPVDFHHVAALQVPGGGNLKDVVLGIKVFEGWPDETTFRGPAGAGRVGDHGKVSGDHRRVLHKTGIRKGF